jgi:hypothetical protein
LRAFADQVDNDQSEGAGAHEFVGCPRRSVRIGAADYGQCVEIDSTVREIRREEGTFVRGDPSHWLSGVLSLEQ